MLSDDRQARPRIFISSVIEGYRERRDAAARGIGRSDCIVVRAEDFRADSVSPRTACLDGVQSSDGVVLILGARYGDPMPAGVSATEEEYREALRLRKRIYAFTERGEHEPRQKQFIAEVQDYVRGHWRKAFSSEDELEELVAAALTEDKPIVALGDGSQEPRRRIELAVAERPESHSGVVWMQAIWTTSRTEQVVDPIHFARDAFQRQVHELAHSGSTPLLDYNLSKQTVPTAARLRIMQGDPYGWREGRNLVVIDVYADGTLSVSSNITGLSRRDPPGSSVLGDLYFIDPADVLHRGDQAWSFAVRWWDHHDPHWRHDPLLFDVALHDVEARRFETPPRDESGGVTVPGMCPHNPLRLLDEPRLLSRRDLASPAEEIARISEMMALRFREWQNRY